jgi:hypothetical protein
MYRAVFHRDAHRATDTTRQFDGPALELERVAEIVITRIVSLWARGLRQSAVCLLFDVDGSG